MKIINVSRVLVASQNFKKLKSGRIDLMISPEKIAMYALKTQIGKVAAKDIQSTLAIDEPVEYDYLLISKKSEKGQFFLKAMNRGLRKLKVNGRYKKIVDDFMKESDLLLQTDEEKKNEVK